MKLEQEILINKYGQNLIAIELLLDIFQNLNTHEKRLYLDEMLFFILQSKAIDADVEGAIVNSGLKPTFTPCILIKKGVANNNLKQLVGLPDIELNKVFKLLLSLFKIAYQRRFQEERDDPNKWWYWDLSNIATVEDILKKR